MFKDKKEELNRLAAALLEEETPTQVIPPIPEEEPTEEAPPAGDELPLEDEPYYFGQETPATYRNFANNYGGVPVRNTDRLDTDLEDFSDAVYDDPASKGIRGLTVLAVCLLLAIAGVFAYCVLRYKGVIR